MGYICPKNTFLQLKHYIQRIYLTLLSATYVKIHQIPYICRFWNHKSFFTTQLVCIILVQILHTFDKYIPSKFKFPDFSLLELKYVKFLHFCITLLHFFSCTFICYWQKTSALIKIYQIYHVIFETKSQFFFKLCITLQCHEK